MPFNQHAELKVVTSSLYSDEESIRVDVHISLQSDISMPLAISALQKQIKKYLEACSGVRCRKCASLWTARFRRMKRRKLRRMPPTALLGLDAEPLPVAERENREETATEEENFEEAAQSEEESKPVQPEEKEEPAETGDNEQGEQA